MPKTDYVPNGITPNPATVTGGSSFGITVTIGPCLSTDPETSTDATTVSLTYAPAGTLPLVSPPTSITVPAGQNSAGATITTTTVTADTVVTITATNTTPACGTVSASCQVTVKAAASAGGDGQPPDRG